MFRNVSWRSRAQVSITGYVSIQSSLFLYSLLLNFHCCSFFSPLPQRSYVAGAGALGYHRNISGLHLIDVVTLANSTEHALCPLQIEKYYYSKLFGVDIHHTSGLLYLSWPWQMEKNKLAHKPVQAVEHLLLSALKLLTHLLQRLLINHITAICSILREQILGKILLKPLIIPENGKQSTEKERRHWFQLLQILLSTS